MDFESINKLVSLYVSLQETVSVNKKSLRIKENKEELNVKTLTVRTRKFVTD